MLVLACMYFRSNMIPSPALVPSHSPTQLPSGGPMVGPVMRPSGRKHTVNCSCGITKKIIFS